MRLRVLRRQKNIILKIALVAMERYAKMRNVKCLIDSLIKDLFNS